MGTRDTRYPANCHQDIFMENANQLQFHKYLDTFAEQLKGI